MSRYMNQLNWENLRYFVAVASTSSMRVAADQLGVSSATLSRHILTLEKSLKVVLFNRRTSGLSLTVDGENLLQQCKQIQSIVTSINKQATSDLVEQEIRIASIPCLAHFKLIPAMSSFNQHWPNLKLVLNSSPELSEFGESSIDIAIRLSRPESGRYLVRRISKLAISVYESKNTDYLVSKDPVPLIVWGSFQGYSSRINDELMQAFPSHRIAVLSNSLFDIIRSIEDGLGIGYLPEYVANEYSNLKKITDLSNENVWMVIREEAERRRCVRDFADHLANSLASPSFNEL